MQIGRFKVWIEFAWYDLWLGVFVDLNKVTRGQSYDRLRPFGDRWYGGERRKRLFICVVPCLPIVVEWWK